MTRVIQKIPDIGEGVHEAEVTKILVKPGETVQEHESVLEIQTDKATLEIPAPRDALVTRILIKEQSVVYVGTDAVEYITTGEEINDAAVLVSMGTLNLQKLNVVELCTHFSELYNVFERLKLFSAQLTSPFIDRVARRPERLSDFEKTLFGLWSPIRRIRSYNASKDKQSEERASISKDVQATLPELIRKAHEWALQANRPKVFIGSSDEALPIARDIANHLKPEIVCVPWKDDPSFKLSTFTLEGLEAALATYDFGIFIFGEDDAVKSKGVAAFLPRDNVVFECGLFMGRLGRDRTFVVRAEGSRILTNLEGLTVARYESSALGVSQLHLVANDLRNAINLAWGGPRKPHKPGPPFQ